MQITAGMQITVAMTLPLSSTLSISHIAFYIIVIIAFQMSTSCNSLFREAGSSAFLNMSWNQNIMGSLKREQLGVVKPVNPRVNQDASLELNCTLTRFNETLFDSRSMYFDNRKYGRADRRVPTEFYSWPNDRTLRMIIPVVSISDDGSQFFCYVNRSVTGEKDAYINSIEVIVTGRPPEVVRNIEVVFHNLEELNITWCINQSATITTYALYYRTVIQEFPGNSRNCQLVEVRRGINENCWRCSLEDTTAYYIRIEASNKYGTTNSTETIIPITLVKPKAIRSLTVTSVRTTRANITWSYPDHALNYYQHAMRLTFNVEYQSKWTRNTIMKTNQTWITLTPLEPGTEYTVTVRCKPEMDGYWSDPESVRFTTSEQAPTTAPEVHPGLFRYFKKHDVTEDSLCNVELFWNKNSIPERERRGQIRGYTITLIDELTRSARELTLDASSRIISLPCSYGHWLDVRAFTNGGPSPPSQMYIPALEKVGLPVDAHADIMDDTTDDVIIGWSGNYANYWVVYCSVDSSTVLNEHSPCSTEQITIVRLNGSISSLAVDMRTFSPSHQLWYSVVGFSGERSSGLTQWLRCVYDNREQAPSSPIVVGDCQATENSVVLRWQTTPCVGRQSARTISYSLKLSDRNAGSDAIDGVFEVSANTSEYKFSNLKPGTNYTIQLSASSRHGLFASSATVQCMTLTSSIEPNTTVIVITVFIVLIVLVAVVIFYQIIVRRRLCLKELIIRVPTRHMTDTSQYDETHLVDNTSLPSTDYTHLWPRETTRQHHGDPLVTNIQESSATFNNDVSSHSTGSDRLRAPPDTDHDASHRLSSVDETGNSIATYCKTLPNAANRGEREAREPYETNALGLTPDERSSLMRDDSPPSDENGTNRDDEDPIYRPATFETLTLLGPPLPISVA